MKVVTRHVWQEDVDDADENRYRYDLKDLYKYRKETIERIFGLAKELHGFRYTQQFGKAQMEVKAALTFACMNLKKLAKKTVENRPQFIAFASVFGLLLQFFQHLHDKPALGLSLKRVCLQAELPAHKQGSFFICTPAQRDTRRFTLRSSVPQRPARNISATGSGRRTSSAFHRTWRIVR